MMPARLRTVLPPAVLFLLNAYICRGLFTMEYLRHMGSIEALYIGTARWAMAHWGDLSWFPLWYDGIPYQNTYVPLLHWMVAFTAWAWGFSPAHAYHWVTAILYCLGPVTLYALVLGQCGSRRAAFAAGAIYSALSPSAWLIPAVVNDLGSLFHPRRLQALVYYGEGPHVSGLTLMPLAFLFVHLALTKRRTGYAVGAVVSLAAVVLTNWLAGAALALGILCYLLARLGRHGLTSRDLVWIAVIGAAAYCLAMPWIPPSTVAVMQANAQTIAGDFRQTGPALPRWAAVATVALLLMKLAMRHASAHLQFAAFFAFLMSLLTLTYEWGRIAIVPQPARYHLELELALVLLGVFAAQALLRRRPRWVGWLAMGALVLALLQPVRLYRRYARNFLIRSTDIAQTSEWKTAQWLNQHWTGERVLMPGSTSFWLLTFSDTPQLGGADDQGPVDDIIRVALYGIYTGIAAGAHDAEFSVLWFKALGVQAVGVTGPGSSEIYKPILNPAKFEGVLDQLWRDGGDAIYRVGQPGASLAHVIRPSDLVMRTPINGIDVDPLRPYVAALENPEFPRAEFRWTSLHSALINTALKAGQEISVQIAWHAGWHATVNGHPTPIQRDALGLMLIEPDVIGPCVIDLAYDGGTEMRIAHGLSAITALLLALASTGAVLKRVAVLKSVAILKRPR
jgi:hypothetical protein